jgi:hypothetical protein
MDHIARARHVVRGFASVPMMLMVPVSQPVSRIVMPAKDRDPATSPRARHPGERRKRFTTAVGWSSSGFLVHPAGAG